MNTKTAPIIYLLLGVLMLLLIIMIGVSSCARPGPIDIQATRKAEAATIISERTSASNAATRALLDARLLQATLTTEAEILAAEATATATAQALQATAAACTRRVRPRILQAGDYSDIKPKARLVGCDLSELPLDGVDLSNADLSWANLSLADLHNAILRDANLSHANLRGANLRNANLRGARCEGADFTHADLSDVQTDSSCPLKAIP